MECPNDFVDGQEEYKSSFDAFMSVSDEASSRRQLINDVLTPSVVEPLTLAAGSGVFRILSIGSGTGWFDFEIIQSIIDKADDVGTARLLFIYTAVEPNIQMLRQFQEAATDRSYGRHQIQFHWHNECFETFLEAAGESMAWQYDLIHLVHSVYYISYDYKVMLERLGSLLQANGFLAIMANMRDSGQVRFPIKCQSLELFEIASPATRNLDDVVAAAKETQLAISAFSSLQFDINVQSIRRKNSIEADLLMEFLTHVKGFRSKVSDAVYDRITALLFEECPSSGKKSSQLPCSQGLAIFKHCY